MLLPQVQTLGSELTASGGGKREASEWQRSANNEHAYRAMLLPGTATGGYLYFGLTGQNAYQVQQGECRASGNFLMRAPQT